MLLHDRLCTWSLDEVFGPGQWCPVCGGEQFVLVEGRLPICTTCEARFELRDTAGDPGVVIDCWPTPDGKYIIRDWPAGRPVHLYQVLKECEGGLADRDQWLTVRGHGLERWWRGRPLGAETCVYRPHDVAWVLAHRDWRRLAPDQQRAEQEYPFVHARQRQHEGTLEQLGRPAGRYLRADAEEVFDDDGHLIHRCIPKAGSQPIAIRPGRH